MPSILDGAPQSVPGAPARIPGGSDRLPSPAPIGGLLTRIPVQETAAQFGQAHFQQVRDTQGRFSGGWGFAWVGLESTAQHIRTLDDRVHQNVREAAQAIADEMLAYAKENAPWQDDGAPTGEHARDALQSGVTWSDADHFTIFLGHGSRIYYGIWLEVRFGGKYAIIVPTIMQFAPLLGEKIRTL